MRLVVQRVSEASVVSDGVLTGRIGRGLMILCGVGPSDDEEAAKLLAKKAAELRIFSDKEGRMNLSVKDLGGQVLVVSQFTLFADIRKGRRPFLVARLLPSSRIIFMKCLWMHLGGTGWRLPPGYSERICRSR